MNIFEQRITAARDDIDELGHVNNAVWVRWIQEVAVAHWHAVARPEHHAAYLWVIARHEIDYLRSLGHGESVSACTWIAQAPRGARVDRSMEFVGEDGRVRVRARTTWAVLDRANGRPVRVPEAVIARFLEQEVEKSAKL